MKAIYNTIGEKYDTTRRADPEIVTTLANLLCIENNKNYLDIACGTGNYTIELNKVGGTWYGFDQSQKMLDEAILKSSKIHWDNVDVEKLSYSDNQFDGAICSLAIHHFPNLDGAFSEISRVLKANAKLVIFTSTPEQMETYWLNQYFPEMMKKSCQQMPSLQEITKSLNKNNLTLQETRPFFIKPNLKDLFLYSGKEKPEMYLSESIRNGISSFKNFCTHSELQYGLTQLEADINSETIERLMSRSKNESDYLFVVATK